MTAQAVEHRGRDVGQHVAADGEVLVAARVGEAHGDAVGARLDRGDLGAAAQLRARRARRRLELGGDRAHPAHRHVPMTAAVADDVVEEAAVLAQVGVVGAREGPDQRVGERDSAHGVVVEAVLDELADRALDERRPRGVVADPRAQLGRRAQRFGHRRPERPRGAGARRVEPLPALDGRRVAGRGVQRRRRALAVLGVDEQAAARGRRAAACRRRSAAGRGGSAGPSSSTIDCGSRLTRYA